MASRKRTAHRKDLLAQLDQGEPWWRGLTVPVLEHRVFDGEERTGIGAAVFAAVEALGGPGRAFITQENPTEIPVWVIQPFLDIRYELRGPPGVGTRTAHCGRGSDLGRKIATGSRPRGAAEGGVDPGGVTWNGTGAPALFAAGVGVSLTSVDQALVYLDRLILSGGLGHGECEAGRTDGGTCGHGSGHVEVQQGPAGIPISGGSHEQVGSGAIAESAVGVLKEGVVPAGLEGGRLC